MWNSNFKIATVAVILKGGKQFSEYVPSFQYNSHSCNFKVTVPHVSIYYKVLPEYFSNLLQVINHINLSSPCKYD